MGLHTKGVSQLLEELEEEVTVMIGFEYRTPTGTPVHHMVPGTRIFDTQGTGHSVRLFAKMINVKT